jgi:hypothetical protein
MALRDLLKETRGSAIWDGVKWLSASGGAGMTTIIHGLWGWINGNPNLAALGITSLTTLCFLGVTLVVFKTQNKTDATVKRSIDDKAQVPQQVPPPWLDPSPEIRDYNILRNKFYEVDVDSASGFGSVV